MLVLITGGEPVRGATPLVLSPSPDNDIAELCRHVAGLSPAASSAIAARAGGNPGDALGLVRALVEQGRLQAGPIGFEAPQGLDHLPETQAQRVSPQVRDESQEIRSAPTKDSPSN
jgi:hypothetical protein